MDNLPLLGQPFYSAGRTSRRLVSETSGIGAAAWMWTDNKEKSSTRTSRALQPLQTDESTEWECMKKMGLGQVMWSSSSA